MTALVNALGMVVAVAIDHTVEGAPLWPSVVSSVIGFASLLYLYLVRKHPLPLAMSTVYLVNSGAVTFAFFLSNAAFAQAGVPWVPFQGNKLSVFVAALLSPTMATGAISILANTALPILQFASFSEATRTRIAVGEPWIMIAFSVAASVLLISRFARFRSEERMAIIENEKLALERSAAKFQSIRDLMNTPLQTLTCAVAVISEGQSEPKYMLAEIERAIAALTKINETLARYEGLASENNGPLSFDGMKVLEGDSGRGPAIR